MGVCSHGVCADDQLVFSTHGSGVWVIPYRGKGFFQSVLCLWFRVCIMSAWDFLKEALADANND